MGVAGQGRPERLEARMIRGDEYGRDFWWMIFGLIVIFGIAILL